MDADTYRGMMRHQAGAVTLIATGKPGARTGLAATAVCSLTDQPPTLLVCVNKSASAHDVIAETGSYSVNILAADQQGMVAAFSGQTGLKGEERFDDELWQVMETGAPVLKDALASFDCEVTEQRQVSTHTIYIAEVRAGLMRAEAEPLVYCRSGFWNLSATEN